MGCRVWMAMEGMQGGGSGSLTSGESERDPLLR